MSSRPSAPATLFDFLSMSKKIPVENGKENKGIFLLYKFIICSSNGAIVIVW
jgi:hypothetical protein